MSFIVRLLNGSTHCDLLQQGVLINYTHGADCATISNKNLQNIQEIPFMFRESLSRVLSFLFYLDKVTSLIIYLNSNKGFQ